MNRAGPRLPRVVGRRPNQTAGEYLAAARFALRSVFAPGHWIAGAGAASTGRAVKRHLRPAGEIR